MNVNLSKPDCIWRHILISKRIQPFPALSRSWHHFSSNLSPCPQYDAPLAWAARSKPSMLVDVQAADCSGKHSSPAFSLQGAWLPGFPRQAHPRSPPFPLLQPQLLCISAGDTSNFKNWGDTPLRRLPPLPLQFLWHDLLGQISCGWAIWKQ